MGQGLTDLHPFIEVLFTLGEFKSILYQDYRLCAGEKDNFMQKAKILIIFRLPPLTCIGMLLGVQVT